MLRARHAVAALILVAAASTPRFALLIHGADQTAAELAAALQHKYDGIKDFSADFTHSYEGGVLKKKITERGHLVVKKPGKMKWDYTAPEAKQFVSDGFKMYSYIPQDKQVVVASVPPENDAATPALFLAGKGSLTRDFTASLVDPPADMPAGSRALKLVPKVRQAEYRFARSRGRSGDTGHPRPAHRGHPGRQVELRLHESAGKHGCGR